MFHRKGPEHKIIPFPFDPPLPVCDDELNIVGYAMDMHEFLIDLFNFPRTLNLELSGMDYATLEFWLMVASTKGM